MQPQTQRRPQRFRNAPREWHHHHLLLVLSMFGSAVLFLFVMIAFFATREPSTPIHVPKYFAYSTVLLLLSSYPVYRLSASFEKEQGRQIIKDLLVAVFAGFLFTLLQVAGWAEMNEAGRGLDNRSASFLVILSGLHLLHVVAITVISTVVMYKVTAKLFSPITKLVYYTNPYQRLILQMLTHAWVFLHVVWVVIYLTFVTVAG